MRNKITENLRDQVVSLMELCMLVPDLEGVELQELINQIIVLDGTQDVYTNFVREHYGPITEVEELRAQVKDLIEQF